MSHSEETKEKLRQINLGKKHSEETKRKISEGRRGKVGFWLGKHRSPLSEETKRKISEGNRGKKHTLEVRLRLSEMKKGEKSNLWKGGITPINRAIRSSLEYRLWREAIFKRDSWTCVWCYQKGGYLQADHIKRFSDYPELRFDLNNGRTLCIDCHKKTHTYGVGRKNKLETGDLEYHDVIPLREKRYELLGTIKYFQNYE